MTTSLQSFFVRVGEDMMDVRFHQSLTDDERPMVQTNTYDGPSYRQALGMKSILLKGVDYETLDQLQPWVGNKKVGFKAVTEHGETIMGEGTIQQISPDLSFFIEEIDHLEA
ncbi:hypothetical protein [Desmospora profundinema]|uniref:Uncharacterized protein n=1 Tax=Desmospora profundinema TaxID=1571184 RepID=A0ABU1IKY4_9BACL|nr:hypothetical protein [Desmospora profundinema]MDR6225217.1 hypothetical protein [Desmospora profundinema]